MLIAMVENMVIGTRDIIDIYDTDDCSLESYSKDELKSIIKEMPSLNIVNLEYSKDTDTIFTKELKDFTETSLDGKVRVMVVTATRGRSYIVYTINDRFMFIGRLNGVSMHVNTDNGLDLETYNFISPPVYKDGDYNVKCYSQYQGNDKVISKYDALVRLDGVNTSINKLIYIKGVDYVIKFLRSKYLGLG